jgi:hypothetical protein
MAAGLLTKRGWKPWKSMTDVGSTGNVCPTPAFRFDDLEDAV